jgi:uncharacterized membrane protein YedE/YeeE
MSKEPVLERASAFAPEPSGNTILRILVGFVVGFLFAVGLAVSGMTRPAKVIGFLDFFGDWDPDLTFVMGGAVLTRFIGRRMMGPLSTPVWGQIFHLPTKSSLDRRLILGAVSFGVGWGLIGFCPGPALTSLATFEPQTLLFIGAMLAGMAVHTLWTRWVSAH